MKAGLLAIFSLLVLVGCATDTKQLNPYITPTDLNKVTATNSSELLNQLGAPTRRTNDRKNDCKVWHYETKVDRPYFSKDGKETYYRPTTLRSMDFCVNSDGQIIRRELTGTIYVHARPPGLANFMFEVRQMTPKELEQKRIPRASGEDPAKVNKYYKQLRQ